MRLPFIVTFLVVVVAAGCGTDKCRKTSEACAETTDCCDGLACFDGACGAPVATCSDDAPVDCGSALPGMCCQTDTPVCCAKDGLCHPDATSCNGCDTKGCLRSTDCCTGFTCARFGKACHAAKFLALGDACTDDAQCASTSCSSYCTKRCTKTTDCGPANQCLDTADGFFCIPFCSINTDCFVFGGTDVTCQKAMDPTGLNLNGCFAK